MKTTRNARFWIFHNLDWIKLTLRPGQTLEFASGGPTEEGYSYHAQHYEFDTDDGLIRCTEHDNYRDCDGPGERTISYVCPIDQLAAREAEPVTEWIGGKIVDTGETRPDRPDWQEERSYQRDVYAEQMGY